MRLVNELDAIKNKTHKTGGKKMKKKKVFALMMAATLALSLAGCGGSSSGDSKSSGSSDSSSVANKDKPLCWFNRQPSNSSTGELDKEALNFNKDTYYVGFDANQGAELQGEMVVDYIKANADKIDRNGDGVIGYVLAIGDIGHNDSIARTRGVRAALGTGVKDGDEVASKPAGTNVDGKARTQQGQHGMRLQQVTQSEHGKLLSEIRSILLFLTMMVWECQCLMHGQKITKFLHSDMMQTVTLLQQSLKDTAEQSLSMQMFRLI